MEQKKVFSIEDISDDDLGLFLWKLQELENFYPCYKSLSEEGEE